MKIQAKKKVLLKILLRLIPTPVAVSRRVDANASQYPTSASVNSRNFYAQNQMSLTTSKELYVNLRWRILLEQLYHYFTSVIAVSTYWLHVNKGFTILDTSLLWDNKSYDAINCCPGFVCEWLSQIFFEQSVLGYLHISVLARVTISQDLFWDLRIIRLFSGLRPFWKTQIIFGFLEFSIAFTTFLDNFTLIVYKNNKKIIRIE